MSASATTNPRRAIRAWVVARWLLLPVAEVLTWTDDEIAAGMLAALRGG